MFELISERHHNAKEVHLVNDRYDVEMSIKNAEHHKGSAMYTGGSRNIFLKPKQNIPSASMFNAFFANAGKQNAAPNVSEKGI